MKFILKFKKNKFSYNQPIFIGAEKISTNEVLHIDVFNNNDLITSIDHIVLPKIHHFTIDQLQQLLLDFFENRDFSTDFLDFFQPLFNTTAQTILVDSQLLFYVEAILLKIIEAKRNDLHFFHENIPILTNSFLRITPSTNQQIIKIKIQPSDDDEKHRMIASYLKLDSRPRLRLDANQSFTAKELIDYFDKIKRCLSGLDFSSIEYIEEPLLDISSYKVVFDELKIPLAIDESIDMATIEKFFSLEFLKTLVLKPSILGISTSLQLISQAQTRYSKDCVISSTYEAGSAFLGHLFLAQKLPFTYHGLDTLHLLPTNLSVLDKKVTFRF